MPDDPRWTSLPPDATRMLPTTGPPGGRGTAPPTSRARRRRSWPRRIALALILLLMLGIGYVATLGTVAYSRIERVDAQPDDGRPSNGGGRTYLLVGSDSRENLTAAQRRQLGTGSAEGRRTDTILLLHDSASGPTVLVSLPRDSYVPIPGRGQNKLNAAYAFGGPKLLVQTVEDVTGVRIDDYVEVGFGGFFQVVEAAGGVRICLKAPLKDAQAHVDLPKGCQLLDGTQALGFVRARYSDPRGDLGRVERQQQFLRSMATRLTSPSVWANPLTATKTALAGGEAISTDRRTGPVDLGRFALAMLSATGADGVNLTVPVADTPTLPGVGSVVRWDRENALRLFNAISDDKPIPKALLPD